MLAENDLIMREIQKLTLMLTQLTAKVIGLNANNSSSGIQETNEALKGEFDLSLTDIVELSDAGFSDKIKGLHKTHLEKLAELIFQIIKKMDSAELDEAYNKKELTQKAILIIDYLEEKSQTFSVKRNELKKDLRKEA